MRNRRHGEPNLSGGSLIANYIYGSDDLEMDAVADVSSRKESSVADVAETDRCRKVFLNAGSAGLLANRFRSGRPYAIKTATVTFRHRHPHMLRISRFIPPVYHLASLGWLRRLVPTGTGCVRAASGSWSNDLVVAQIRWCLPRANQAAGVGLEALDRREPEDPNEPRWSLLGGYPAPDLLQGRPMAQPWRE
jgi:hypothetical protein